MSMLLPLLASLAWLPAVQVAPPNDKAQIAYDALQAKLGKAQSAKATIEVRSFGRTDTYAFRFLRPNFAKIVSPESAIYQTGFAFYDWNPLDKEYFSKPMPSNGVPAGTAFSLGGMVGFEALGFANEPKMVATALARRSFSGVPTSAISLRSKTDPNLVATLYVDVKTGLPLGWDYSLQDFKASGRFKDIELNAPLKPADFAWKPPAGAKRVG